jgi:glycosyltransferase involved in cell wall biosynthesis
MRILHATPHLPPDQAANALLPFHLGTWARDAGYDVRYAAHRPRAGGALTPPGPVTWIRARHEFPAPLRVTRIASLAAAWRVTVGLRQAVDEADVVHVHSNGLLSELVARLARARGRPVVVTLYGTEIWHYRPRPVVDLFTSMVRGAARVAYYSRKLLERAREHGLRDGGQVVVYPPVADVFRVHDAAGSARLRRELGVHESNLLVNVKRLHPLAAQEVLIDAMPAVLRAHPDTRLVICGTGPLRAALDDALQRLGVAHRVSLLGLVDNETVARYCAAADLFVLPSLLEACPTVAVEALASGTPVVSSDNPGGLELHGLFGDDVAVVPRGQSERLAEAIVARLASKRRTLDSTAVVLEREFRPPVVWRRYRTLYEEAVGVR